MSFLIFFFICLRPTVDCLVSVSTLCIDIMRSKDTILLIELLFQIHSKMPEREDDNLTPATRLLEKRREMSEVEQALTAQKEVEN